jgi:hypothetical protein
VRNPLALSSRSSLRRIEGRPSIRAGVARATQDERVSSSPWLFSRSTDLWVFGGSAAAAVFLVALGLYTGQARGDAPPWLWLLTVLLVDVSHVWSTVFRVYTDPVEVRRRPLLYIGAPIGLFALGFALHLHSPGLFWRVLAYAAVFHFVRQQYGWVMLFRRRAGETGRLSRAIDALAIYAATLYPLLYWHAHLPRRFSWFLPGDFAAGLSATLEPLLPWARALAWAAYLLYVASAIESARRGRRQSWGKHLVLFTTWLCWYGGIVWFNSDYVFTVSNVLIHGIPYFALVWHYSKGRYRRGTVAQLFRLPWGCFYGLLVAAAFLEEGGWNGLVWHDHPQFFGTPGIQLGSIGLALAVALLAVPQALHYLLDGFVWRGGAANPKLLETLGLSLPKGVRRIT